MSYNVLTNTPHKQPGPFARLFRALQPDMLLVQEWDDVDAAELAAWFDERVPFSGRWHVRQSAARGVAIVCRVPLARLGPYRLELRPADRERVIPNTYFGGNLGFVGAVAETPIGPMAGASVHLTCCGGANTPEDVRRTVEAQTVNRALRMAGNVNHLVMAGDLNLVGTREPLDRLRSGLDENAMDLETVEAAALGTEDLWTWRDDRQPFPPGRLDWMVYSGQTLGIAQSFILDCGRLTDTALRVSGLTRTDCSYSDHLPIVADMKRRG
jgi:endonuclease/exonuclease/phosphatase family metal-dependent hydrolase